MWKQIEWKGFKLEVCDDGSIRRPAVQTKYSQVRGGAEHVVEATFPARPLRPYKTNMGYMEVGFVASRRRYRELVHRLIAMAFVDGYEPGKCVNHINGDKLDNRPENLEWISLQENTAHAWREGLVDLRGEKQPGAKLTEKQVRAIKMLLAKGVSANSLAVVAGVNPGTVYLIRDGLRWKWVATPQDAGSAA